MENFLKKSNVLSFDGANKKILVICNDLDKENFSILYSHNADIYDNNIVNNKLIKEQENKIQLLNRQFTFTQCNLSEIDKNSLEHFLKDYI